MAPDDRQITIADRVIDRIVLGGVAQPERRPYTEIAADRRNVRLADSAELPGSAFEPFVADLAA